MAYPVIPAATALDVSDVMPILQSGRAEKTVTLPILRTYLENTTTEVPRVGVLEEDITALSFTDGGAAVGTKTMTGTIPAGAVILGTKVLVTSKFNGDTSAALIIGDGSDTDRYNTGTIDLFSDAPTGVQSGVPSGSKLQIAAVSPVLTVTSAADFTPVRASGGLITVSIYYIVTV